MTHSVDKQIFEYCKDGQAQLLFDALATLDDFEIKDIRGNSLLSIALKYGHWQIAEELFERSNICACEESAIISACQYRTDDPQGVVLVLNHNHNVNIQNAQLRTALMTTCLLGHFKTTQELLDNNADCNLVDKQGNTALIEAVRAKNLKIIDLIIPKVNEINHANNEGDTALHVAIKQKTPLESIITVLLAVGADPELLDGNKKSAWLIAKQKHTKLSRLIEKHLNSINQIELPFFSNDYTPSSKIEEKQEATEPTKEADFDRIEPTLTINNLDDKEVLLEDITVKKTSEIFDFRKKESTHTNEQEWFHAAKNGNLGGLNRMIIAGIDINCVDDKGCSALIRACGHSRRAVVSFLLQQKADIELRSKNGSTALSSSVIGNCRRVAGLLLERGANPNGLGPSDYSYATIAAAQWNDAMLSILYRNKADIFVLNNFQQNLIHIIALGVEYNTNINIAKTSMQFLMDHGIDINLQDANGNTALMILCGAHSGKYKVEDRDVASIVHYLLKKGAAPAITNTAGESAIDATRLHKLQQTKGVLMNALSWNDK